MRITRERDEVERWEFDRNVPKSRGSMMST